MPVLKLPLFCWQVDEDAIFAKVIGFDYQIIDTNLSKIKKRFSEWVKKEIEHDYYEYEAEVTSAKLVLTQVKLHLAYREEKALYPAPNGLNLRVAGVYGENVDAGYWKCYLPMLDTEFYYYDKHQLLTLLQHFSKEVLEGCTPEIANRYILDSDPWLEEIKLNISDKPVRDKKHKLNVEDVPVLANVAEMIPYSKKIRKRLALIPETAWERAGIIERLVSILVQNKKSILLIGEEGVGKTTIWLEVIKKLHKKQKKNDLPNTYWRTTAQRLIANAKYLGEWQEICENIVDDIKVANGSLWVLDCHHLLHTGGESVEDSVAAFLLPFMQSGQLHMVGEMNQAQLETVRRLLPGFLESFQLIPIDELSLQSVQKILNNFNQYSQQNLGVEFTKAALSLSYHLLDRYLQYERFPGKAIRFLSASVRNAKLMQQNIVDKQSIMQQLVAQTGLPEMILNDHIILQRHQLIHFFKQRIIGQNDALGHLCSVIETYKAGLNDPQKPIATLFFSGPTGVGKTAAAKALAEYFFSLGQQKQPLFRIDMSEFQHPYQLQRLMGGNNKPGKLVEHMRNCPFSVILLDEIEKAESFFFDVLLTIMDEGRFVDAYGRLTDFRQAIVIMTSNIGSKNASNIGFVEAKNEVIDHKMMTYFRPEFYNRIDKVIPFQPLNSDSIRQIASKELASIEAREGLKKRQLTLSCSQQVIDYISERGFDVKYGARPLQRVVEMEIVAPLSKYIIDNPGLKRCVLRVALENREIIINQ